MAITDFLRKKKIDVTSISGTPTISRTMCLKIAGSDDSVTGTGDIVLDWTNITSKADIGVYDENDNLLDYYFETFNETEEKAVIWVYRDWVQDGSIQLQVAYGDGPSDQSVSASTVFDKETDLKAGYLFNEDSGDLLDITSNGNDGTVYGASQGEDGLVGKAYSHDGNDDYISLPASSIWDFFNGDNSEWTIEIDVKTTENGKDEFTTPFIERRAYTVDHGHWIFHLKPYNGKAGLWISDTDSDTDLDLQGTVDISDGNWHHITAVKEQQDVRLYTDNGDEVTGSISYDWSADKDITLAVRRTNDGSKTAYLESSIGSLRITARAVSSDERSALYSATKSSPDFFSQQSGQDTAVNTDSPTNVTSTSVTLNGNLGSLQGESNLDVWFDYSTDDSFSSYDSTSTQTLSSTGSFSDDITGLTALETYYVRAATTDGTDTWYGGTESFIAADFEYVEDEGSDFETGELDGVEVVDGELTLELQNSVSDDFEDDTIDDTLWDWDENGGSITEAGGILELEGGGGSDRPMFWTVDQFISEDYCYIKSRAKCTSDGAIYIFARWSAVWGGSYGEPKDFIGIFAYYNSDTDIRFLIREGSSNVVETTISSVNKTDYHDYEIYIYGDNSDFDIEIYIDGDLAHSDTGLSFSPSTGSGEYKGLSSREHPNTFAYFDDFIINNGYLSSGTRTTPEIDISTLSAVEDSVVKWTSDEPIDTSITIETAISEDGGSTWGSWQICTNGSAVPGLSDADLSDARIKFKQILETTDEAETPELSKFEFYVAETAGSPGAIVGTTLDLSLSTATGTLTTGNAITGTESVLSLSTDAGTEAAGQALTADATDLSLAADPGTLVTTTSTPMRITGTTLDLSVGMDAGVTAAGQSLTSPATSLALQAEAGQAATGHALTGATLALSAGLDAGTVAAGQAIAGTTIALDLAMQAGAIAVGQILSADAATLNLLADEGVLRHWRPLTVPVVNPGSRSITETLTSTSATETLSSTAYGG